MELVTFQQHFQNLFRALAVQPGGSIKSPSDIAKNQKLSKTTIAKIQNWNKCGLSLLIAVAFMSLFIFTVIYAVFLWNIHQHYIITTALLIIAETYLFTAIFITAHDAMHGLIVPKFKVLNRFIGQLCVKMFAMFDYSALLNAHNAHHQHSGDIDHDPDYHEFESESELKTILMWFYGFMKEYTTLGPLLLRVAIYQLLTLYVGVSHVQLNLFWSLPNVLSSFQLFYYGTYLVHRRNHGNFNNNFKENEQNAFTDYSKSVWYHLLTCFCFGVHYEHHKYPYLPWWGLMLIYQSR
jgi:beta-carotene ketolase (CrtW type)